MKKVLSLLIILLCLPIITNATHVKDDGRTDDYVNEDKYDYINVSYCFVDELGDNHIKSEEKGTRTYKGYEFCAGDIGDIAKFDCSDDYEPFDFELNLSNGTYIYYGCRKEKPKETFTADKLPDDREFVSISKCGNGCETTYIQGVEVCVHTSDSGSLRGSCPWLKKYYNFNVRKGNKEYSAFACYESTYQAEFPSEYIYGEIGICQYGDKIEINGNDVCISDKPLYGGFTCDNSNTSSNNRFQQMELSNIRDTEGNKYYGWVCAKKDYTFSEDDDLDVNIGDVTCDSLFGDPNDKVGKSPAWFFSFAFSIIRYIAIILLILLTMMDFVSAVSSQDGELVKKATNKAIKRAIICVVIFLLPFLINFILSFLHDKSINDCINVNM